MPPSAIDIDSACYFAAVTIPKEQVKDGEVFHMLSEKAVEIVREKVGGEKVQLPTLQLL